jgi:hypothetical protein
VAGGLLPMEGNRNSKDWGESCLDKLGRFSEGLKEVRLIDHSQKRNRFFSMQNMRNANSGAPLASGALAGDPVLACSQFFLHCSQSRLEKPCCV